MHKLAPITWSDAPNSAHQTDCPVYSPTSTTSTIGWQQSEPNPNPNPNTEPQPQPKVCNCSLKKDLPLGVDKTVAKLLPGTHHLKLCNMFVHYIVVDWIGLGLDTNHNTNQYCDCNHEPQTKGYAETSNQRTFVDDLAAIINYHGIDTKLDTPDTTLANFLVGELRRLQYEKENPTKHWSYPVEPKEYGIFILSTSDREYLKNNPLTQKQKAILDSILEPINNLQYGDHSAETCKAKQPTPNFEGEPHLPLDHTM